MYKSDAEAKNAIISAGKKLYARGFVAANDGNITARMEDGTLWSTPTGVSKGDLTEEMLVHMTMDGKILEGTWKVSSEAALHRAIYEKNPGLGGIVHAHCPGATAWSATGRDWNLAICLDSALNLGVVPCVPYATTGSRALAETAAPYSVGHTALLLEHHGAVTWGADVQQALFRMESLEQTFRIYGHMKQFGEVRLLSEAQLDEIEEVKKKYGIVNPRAKGGPNE